MDPQRSLNKNIALREAVGPPPVQYIGSFHCEKQLARLLFNTWVISLREAVGPPPVQYSRSFHFLEQSFAKTFAES